MESKSSPSLEILAWTAILAALVSMFETPALSQERAPEIASGIASLASRVGRSQAASAAPFKACLQISGNRCTLVADTVGISIRVADGDAVISYVVPVEGGWKIDRSESVNEDMEAQVLAGNINEDDAAVAFAELLSSHDLAYKIPANTEQLKAAVGLPPSAVLTPQDQVDVIGSHLQMTLGLSAVTADYLVMKLGMEIVDPGSEGAGTGGADAASASTAGAGLAKVEGGAVDASVVQQDAGSSLKSASLSSQSVLSPR